MHDAAVGKQVWLTGVQLMGQDLAVPFPQGHASLRQLKLNWVPMCAIPAPAKRNPLLTHRGRLRGRQAELTPWALLFRTLTRTQFPALREVQLTYNMDIWPTSECVRRSLSSDASS